MLVYDTTSSDNRPPDGRSAAAPTSARTVGALFALLRRRAPWILAWAIAGALAAFLGGKALTPRFSAEAQLYIDPRDLHLFDKELTPGNQDSAGLLTIVESQAQVITSNSVLKRVVERMNLGRDPEFTGGGPSLLERFGLASPSDSDPARDGAVVLEALKKRVYVGRAGRTFIVDVGVWSVDADKAARLANTIVASYLAEDRANRAEAATTASAGLTAQLAELRRAVVSAEDRVQAHKIAHDLIGTRDTLVTDQQLTQLNAQLSAARVRVGDAQARFDQFQRLQAAGLDQGATIDALASPTIGTLRSQYAELSRRQTELLHDLGPRHPLVTAIAPQVQQARRLIDQEVARYGQSARNDLNRAQANVATLERSFEQAQRKTTRMGEASIELRQLEGDVEASRNIYQAFLVRARETGQQASLNIGNARVITTAMKPLTRSFPPPARVLALLGFAAGLLTGTAFVLAQEGLRRDMGTAEPEGSRPPPEPARTPRGEAGAILAFGGATSGHPGRPR